MSDELTELPEGWEWTSFEELAERIPNALKAGPFGSALKKSFYVPSGYKIYGQEQVINEDPFFGDYYIDKGRYEALKSCAVKPGDILISLVGTIGKVLILPNGIKPGIINPRLVKLSLDKSLSDNEYIKKYLESPTVRSYFSSISHGGTMDILNLSILKTLKIPLPPINEQKRIVAKIEELRDRLHRSKQALEAVPELCDRFRQSVLAAAFRGDLTADWREENPDVEPASVLLERIGEERYQKWEDIELQKSQRGGKSVKGDKWKTKYQKPEPCNEALLPELPNGWAWVPVELLATKVVDGVHKKPNYVENGIPFVTVKNLTAGSGISFDNLNYVSKEDHEEFFKRANPEKGDLLISKDGTLGVTRVVRTDTIFSIFVSVALVKPVSYKMSDYLELAFTSPQMQNRMLGTGSGLQHIHLKDLRRYAVPVTSLEEQAEIVVRVRKLFNGIDQIQEQYNAAEANLTCLNQSILAKAFRGELVEQDPNDEPASVLLDCIRTEREALQGKKKSRSTKGRRKKE